MVMQPVTDSSSPSISSSSCSGKRKSRATNATASKRRNKGTISAPSISVPVISAVGPSSASLEADTRHHPVFQHVASASATTYGSLVIGEPSESERAATDVWFFVRGLHSTTLPDVVPETEALSEKRPDKAVFEYLGCRLCKGDKWTTWKNCEGQTTTIRAHLSSRHGKYWQDLVLVKELKNWRNVKSNTDQEAHEREPFTLEGFYERLVRWVVVDDQSVDVIDCRELRDLLLYIGLPLEEKDIPHRTKLTELITLRFLTEYKQMIDELQNVLGRLAWTTDLWSRKNLGGCMGLTAHGLVKSGKTGNLKMRSFLVAFRQVEGHHTGAALGKVFVQIVREVGCLHKISTITCDNASNNNTLMQEVASELKDLNIPFDVDGNRIRCFPHVINIAVKAGLQNLMEMPIFDDDLVRIEKETSLHESLVEDRLYYEILDTDVVACARRLVTACRASGRRRELLEELIIDGNTLKLWGGNKQLRVVGLLRDVETRWSSTFLMIDRVLEQYPAIQRLLAHSECTDISHFALSDKELEVLNDIRRFLYVPHVVQELVSAEKTPTLSVVLPMYERLITMLEALKKSMPKLSHAISASVKKLQEYLILSRKTKVYALAIVLNPTTKFEWLKKHWSEDEYMSARKLIHTTLLEYQRDIQKQQQELRRNCTAADVAPSSISRRIITVNMASNAAKAQLSGLGRLKALEWEISDSDLSDTLSEEGSLENLEVSLEEECRRELEEDTQIVDAAICRYEEEGLIDKDHPEMIDFDILRYWQSHQGKHTLFWRAALDVLPIQASAVSCERVFSSSAETDTLRRSNISSVLMEVLQVLKFRYRNDRMSFTEDLIDKEDELSVIDIPPEVIDDLMSKGKIEELMLLVDQSWEKWERSL